MTTLCPGEDTFVCPGSSQYILFSYDPYSMSGALRYVVIKHLLPMSSGLTYRDRRYVEKPQRKGVIPIC